MHESLPGFLALKTPDNKSSHESNQPRDSASLLQVNTRLWPRFWARCVDITLCLILILILANLIYLFFIAPTQRGATEVARMWSFLITAYVTQLVVVFVYDVSWLHFTGTSPGKALFLLRVSNQHGKRPSIGQSAMREFDLLRRVLFLFGYPLITLVLLWSYYSRAKRESTTPWDSLAETHIEYYPLSPLRILAATLLTSAVLVLHFAYTITLARFQKDEDKRILREDTKAQMLREIRSKGYLRTEP